MTEQDEACRAAWADWHHDIDQDDMPRSSPAFEHGFRMGAESPGVSARVVWDSYCKGSAGTIPPALVEGINRGAWWSTSQKKPAPVGVDAG